MLLLLQIVFISTLLQLRPVFGALEPYIVGGRFASIYKFPHSACLKVAAKLKDTHYYVSFWVCGGSLLTDRVLLTAAHCLDPGDGSQVTVAVTVGTNEKDKGKDHEARFLAVHNGYDAKKFASDIGLLAMPKKFKFSNQVERVAVMRSPPYHERAMVAGWGYASETLNETSKYLKYAAQNLMNHSSCEQILLKLPAGVICGMDSDDMYELKGYAAPGDSGSALVVRNYIQVGLVSFKFPQYNKRITVYTEIGYFYDWILETASRMHCKSKKLEDEHNNKRNT